MKLHQRDMFLLCSFLNDWAKPTLQELSNRRIRYEEENTRYELRKFVPRARRSARDK